MILTNTDCYAELCIFVKREISAAAIRGMPAQRFSDTNLQQL